MEANNFIWVGLGALVVLVLQRLLRVQTPLRGVGGMAAPPVPAPPAPAPQPPIIVQVPGTFAQAAGPGPTEGGPSYETWITIPTKITVQPQPPQSLTPDGPRLA